MGKIQVKASFGNAFVEIETGHLAKQSNGAVVVKMGETVVLVTVAGNKTAKEGTDFLPLTCEYMEKKYASGKIPGGFFKREGKSSNGEILTSRLMDRPMRPLFPKMWRADIQIIATVLAFDKENDPAICAMLGASAATHISELPFDGPMAGCRICLINGKYEINPSLLDQEKATLNLVVAATADEITMVEGEGKEASETEVLDAMLFAHQAIKPIIELQNQLRAQVGKQKWSVEKEKINVPLFSKVIELSVESLDRSLPNDSKVKRKESFKAVKDEVCQKLFAENPAYKENKAEIAEYLESVYRTVVRSKVVDTKIRMDGRRLDQIRNISCEIDSLPRVHGSAVFTRGETQALGVVTLGAKRDEQRIDSLEDEYFERFMLHYNFPPFCTGEVKPLRGQSRREVGHGNLAYRGVKAILPDADQFKYTIRVVSEVLESNGSSSMATVCASSMALMNAGVPVKKQVAGIAMGLIQEDNKIAVLSDILGDEDHLGDMDFKVVGTRDGITAIQMDMKVQGLSRDILEKALEQARQGRLFILNQMDKAIKLPKLELGKYAPRIIEMKVNADRLKDIIGPGGKMIRHISETTECSIDLEDNGTVLITGPDLNAAKKAQEMIKSITQEAEPNKEYAGTIKKVADFGLFVEVLPGTEGLLHISELKFPKGTDLNQYYKEGQALNVRCLEVSKEGKIKLTLQDAASVPQVTSTSQPAVVNVAEVVEPLSIGRKFEGEVKKIMEYGVFVGLPGYQDGLLHVSQLGIDRSQIPHVYKEGQKVKVEVAEIQPNGKVNLSLIKEGQSAPVAQQPKANRTQHLPYQQAPQVQQVQQHQPVVQAYQQPQYQPAVQAYQQPQYQPAVQAYQQPAQVNHQVAPYPQYQQQNAQQGGYKSNKPAYQPRTERKPQVSQEVEIEEDSSGVQVGQTYLGIVKRIVTHGVFVELAPGIEGMVHISELADHRVANIEDIVDLGEQIYVKCVAIAKDGKIKLSRKEALME